MKKPIRILILALVFASLVGATFVWEPELSRYFNQEEVARLVLEVGNAGPLLIIVLMIVAVVASPIPSAPIALAAGAAYGHYFGALYVAIGAELGALLAFLIARYFGKKTVARFLGNRADHGLLGSQNALTLVVFTSRLLPFISFDAMSYAAGLSCIKTWRFALATLAGIIPASFILAHFGREALSGDFGSAEWLILGLGLITAAPLLIVALRQPSIGDSP